MNMEKDNKNIIIETIINGNRLYIENGEVKTQLNEEIQRTGYMSIEDAKQLSIEKIKTIYNINQNTKL